MLISHPDSTDSLANLFELLDMRFSGRLVAVGRPEPAVPGMQYAHVKIAYTAETGANPTGILSDGQHCCVVHTAMVVDGSLKLSGGTYDLTPEQAWKLVR